MTTIEEQLRTYATAVAGPVRHRCDQPDADGSIDASTQRPGTRGPKLALRAAALVLVVVAIAAVLAVRSRSEDNSPASSATEWYPLRVELEVSTTTPSPTQTVQATMTVTNISADPFEVPQPCPSDISLTPTAEVQTQDNPPAIPPDLEGTAPSDGVQPVERLRALFSNFTMGSLFQPEDPSRPCHGGTIELQPGESTSTTGYREMAGLGLDPIDMSLAAAAKPYIQTRVVIPFTMPPSPDGVLTRSAALDLALAQPAVQQFAQTAADDPPPGEPDMIGRTGFKPVDDGWEMSYESGDHRLVVQINSDGTGTIAADGVESPIDPTLAD